MTTRTTGKVNRVVVLAGQGQHDSLVHALTGMHVVNGERSLVWHITTKYYEADLTLDVGMCASPAHPSPLVAAEAAIVVFPAADAAAWARVQPWLQLLADTPSVEVRMVFADSRLGVHADAATWQAECAQHGVEWVCGPCEPCFDTGPAPEPLLNAPEATGVQRVRQALLSHVWPQSTLATGIRLPSPSAVMTGAVTEGMLR